MSTFTANANFRIVMDRTGKVTNFENGTPVNPCSQPVATATLCLRKLENGKWEKIEGTSFTNDTIDGGAGVDYLTDGSGADVFRFVRPMEGGDTITDFQHGTDKIQVVSGNFGTVGVYLAGATLPTLSPCLVYNQATGSLTFNNGAGTNYALVTLGNKPILTSSDILIVAT